MCLVIVQRLRSFFPRSISTKWQKASGGQWPTFLDLLRPDKSPVQLAKQHVASMLTGESKRLGILAVAAGFPHVHEFVESKPEVWPACRNKFLALSAKLHQQHDAYVKKHEHLSLGDQRVPQGERLLKAIQIASKGKCCRTRACNEWVNRCDGEPSEMVSVLTQTRSGRRSV